MMKTMVKSATLLEAREVGNKKRTRNLILTGILTLILIVVPAIESISRAIVISDKITHMSQGIPQVLGANSIGYHKLTF